MMRADEGFISDACPMQPLGLGMQGGPLVPPAQQWGVWACFASRIWLPRRATRLRLVLEALAKHKIWLVPLSLGHGVILRRIHAHGCRGYLCREYIAAS